MVSKMISTSVFLCRLLVASLLVSLTSFGMEEGGCQLCFVRDVHDQWAADDLVRVSSESKSSEGKPTSGSSCTCRLITAQKASKPESCTTASTIQVLDVCERLSSQVPAKKRTPFTVPAISFDSGSPSNDKKRFVAALHTRAQQCEPSFSPASSSPVGSINILTK